MDILFCLWNIFLGNLLQLKHLVGTDLRVWLHLKLAVEVHIFAKNLFLLLGTAAESPRVHQVLH
jgi:hypothetical protein